jgi:hypothetical protein
MGQAAAHWGKGRDHLYLLARELERTGGYSLGKDGEMGSPKVHCRLPGSRLSIWQGLCAGLFLCPHEQGSRTLLLVLLRLEQCEQQVQLLLLLLGLEIRQLGLQLERQ